MSLEETLPPIEVAASLFVIVSATNPLNRDNCQLPIIARKNYLSTEMRQTAK